MLALPNHRRQLYSQSISIPQQDHQHWSPTSTATSSSSSTTTTSAPAPLISTPQPQYHNTTSSIFSFGQDQPLFDYQSQHQFPSPQPQPLMQSEHTHNSWLENGQLTPRSATRAHHREPSLSSLGSAGPSSPYTANTSNPQVVGDIYHEFHDYQHNSSKPLTPAHTPSQEHFLTPHYSNFYHNPNLPFAMGHDGLPKQHSGSSELMAAPEFNHSGRPSISSTVANDSPSTPPSYEEDRQKNGESSRFDLWLSEYLQHCDDECIQERSPKTEQNNDGRLYRRTLQPELPTHLGAFLDSCTERHTLASERCLLPETSSRQLSALERQYTDSPDNPFTRAIALQARISSCANRKYIWAAVTECSLWNRTTSPAAAEG